ncbi:Ig-like domain-containing domain [Echinicola arenosa]|nr:Ig-like domain-containing domain [Echinicola arenosa]
MGGPKDEAPPQLLSSNPKDQSLNIKPEQIILEFNEYIKADNPIRNIIITPSLEKDKMEILPIKNTLKIKLNQELEDSTTYVFNFQKSIQDISENNPAENLKLVFSTGRMIDSLSFSGKVDFIFPPKTQEIKDVLVGLYRIQDDTMDVFSDPPYYLTQADSSGNFEITNIKGGKYRAYAFQDNNNTSKAEFKSEQYSFITDTVSIMEDVTNAHFSLYRGDLSDFKVNRTSAIGSNFDVVLSKSPASLRVEHPDIGQKLFYRLDEKQIRFYHTEIRDDSTQVKLIVQDSVGFKIDTTLYASFMNSDRKAQLLEVTLGKNKEFNQSINTDFSFNKPVNVIHYDSLYIQYDSASFIQIKPEHLSFKDSARRTELVLTVPINDTLSISNYNLLAADSTFEDVEGQYNKKSIKTNFKKQNTDDLADEVSGKILTDELPIIVQLLNTDETVVKEIYLTENFDYSFKKIKAGEYKIRAIIDRNGNKKWDPGNYQDKRQPEPVYYYFNQESKSYKVLLRGKWTNNDVNIDARRETGLPQTPIEEPKEVEEISPNEM